MNNERNISEYQLLKQDPRALIVSYQPVIKIIVQRYVFSGFIKKQDREDFIQHINEELLQRIDKIQQQYNGKAQVRTYISVIIRNICIEVINKQKKSPEEAISPNTIEVGVEETLSAIIIDQEIDRFHKILTLFYKQKARIELCLKSLYRIPVKQSDLEAYYPGLDDNYYQDLISKVNPKEKQSDKDIYQIMTPFLNKCENKNNSPDAIRKWTKMKIEELVSLMNGTPKRANYNEETLQILVEKYYLSK